MTNIFIGGAWPYANGSLHLGRLASILPGDILARYHRAKGDAVLYVSGSDCHGTPVAVQAAQEGVTPGEFASRYHEEFADCFRALGFTYDLYTRTDQTHHHSTVQELFLKLLDHGYLYQKPGLQCYCGQDQRFLPDRYVHGLCPVCGQQARGTNAITVQRFSIRWICWSAYVPSAALSLCCAQLSITTCRCPAFSKHSQNMLIPHKAGEIMPSG